MQEDIFSQASEALQEQEWFQELFNEEGVYQDLNTSLSTRGDFVFIVDPSEKTISVHDINDGSVGQLSLAPDDEDNLWLHEVEVNKSVQNQGIGTELVRLAVKYLEDFFIPGVQQSDDYVFSLSPEGVKLINACLRQGFIDEAKIRFDVPLEDDADEDPDYIIYSGRIGEIYAARMPKEEDSNSPSLSRSPSP
jgi:RimJ/RimL family protein N-acetyltransferase